MSRVTPTQVVAYRDVTGKLHLERATARFANLRAAMEKIIPCGSLRGDPHNEAAWLLAAAIARDGSVRAAIKEALSIYEEDVA